MERSPDQRDEVSEDIVTRLRYPVHAVPPLEAGMHQLSELEEQLHCQYLDCRLTMNEAADEIERLRAALDQEEHASAQFRHDNERLSKLYMDVKELAHDLALHLAEIEAEAEEEEA